MTLLRKLAIIGALSWFLAVLTWGYAGEDGSIVQYIHRTFRVLATITLTAWFVVWWFSSDRQE